jgi:hypothetical protein
MKDLRKWLCPGAAGTLTWTWSFGGESSISYFVTGNAEPEVVTLRYRLRDAEDVCIPIRLESTPTQFGGQRRWLVCPLVVAGVPCHRRAAKLYLPSSGRYFGCRKCHDLTYRSCQEAHREERVFGRWGFGPEVPRMMRERSGAGR